MKKLGVFLLLFLFVFVQFALAANNSSNSTSNSGDSDIDNAYSCLEDKVGSCTTLKTQELALTIMATPEDGVFDDCVNELQTREKNSNWGNVRDTALAVLALQHAGKDVAPYIEWLQKQGETPSNLIWYIQEDSGGEAMCNIAYDTNDYEVTFGENKKVSGGTGNCLTAAQYNFWLEVDPDCYETEFNFECDKDFIINLLYKNRDASTIYVLENTQSSPKFNSLSTSVTSKCFGSGTCDYEGTVWTALALYKAGKNIDDYIPYIVAMADTNKNYLPDAFVYMLTNYDDYANKLVSDQRLGDFWQADSTSYSKYYDTALALLSLGTSSTEQAQTSKDWLLFSQGSNGCWGNSIRDTAIVLWAIVGKADKQGGGGGSATYCTQADYFCIATDECPSDQQLGNFFCNSPSTTCCETENLKNCNEYSGGTVCGANERCSTISRKALDTSSCCLGTCEEKPQENECEANYYNCYDGCLDNQEEKDYSCDGGQVCCGTTNSGPEPKKSLWWLWVLLGILIVGVALAIIYKDKLKEMIGKKKGGGKSGPNGRPPMRPGMPPTRPGMPPRGMPPKPGFPPVVRQNVPARRPMPRYKEDPAMRETFRKLRKIAER